MEKEEYNFTVLDDNGNEVICDVMSVLHDEKTHQIYVLYTDYSLDEDDKFNTYLSELVENNGEYSLKNIDDKEKCKYLLQQATTIYGEVFDKVKKEESN